MRRQILACALALLSFAALGQVVQPPEADKTVRGTSQFPVAASPALVGTYPALVKSGGGYFYDDVLEYRVWLHPERGANRTAGGSDYFAAFAQYERALEFAKSEKGAEPPLVLIRQREYVNEPAPGVFEVVREERLAEWRVEWLVDHKRSPGSIDRFMQERRR